jgi:arylsulfatase A-like enzyme
VDKPNLVFIMPDQLRPDFLGCYGADFIATPHIDALAARGVRYTRAYSEHPICVPARNALLTGMHALRSGVLDNGLALRPDYAACGIATWPELLAAQGYGTAAIGKMHFYPWDARFGFGYRRIAEDKRWLHVRDDYFHFLHERGHRKYHGAEHEGYFEQKGAIVNRLPREWQPDQFVGAEACRYIRQYGDEGPFSMMVGFPGPHCPYDPANMPAAIPDAGDTPALRAANIVGNRGPGTASTTASSPPRRSRGSAPTTPRWFGRSTRRSARSSRRWTSAGCWSGRSSSSPPTTAIIWATTG